MIDKKLYKFIFIILSVLFIITNVHAEECTTEEFRELKQFASEIKLSYDFDLENKLYKLNLYNFDKRFYIVSSDFGYIEYKSNKQFIGNYIKGGTYKYDVYASDHSNCYGEKLITLKYSLPIYNRYYTWDECKNKKNLDICKKWYDTSNITEAQFKTIIQEHYNENNKKSFIDIIVEFLKVNYIYFIIFVGFSVAFLIIFTIVKNIKRKKIEW